MCVVQGDGGASAGSVPRLGRLQRANGAPNHGRLRHSADALKI